MRGKISRKRKAKKESIGQIRQNEPCYYCKKEVKEEEASIYPQTIKHHRCHLSCWYQDKDNKVIKDLK